MTDGSPGPAPTALRRALFRSRRSAIRVRRRTTGPVGQGRNLPGTASGTNEAAPFFDLRERSRRIERQGFEGDRRRMQAHRVGASHEEARNALRLKGSDRGRLDGHEKTRSFIAKFANSFCNRQANLPSAFATSTPERFHRPSAWGFVRGIRRRGFLSLPSRLLSCARVGVALGPMRAKSSTEIRDSRRTNISLAG
jgi:hypothetical protein